MKNISSISLVVFITLFLFSACRKGAQLNDSLTAIPANTVSVTAINIPSLMQKADFESVKNMDFYKKMIAESEKENPPFSEILKDPKKSGVDLTKNIYFIQEYDFMSSGNSNAQPVLLISLADVGAFEAMLQMAKSGSVQTQDGIKYIKTDKEQSTMTEEGYEIGYKNNNMIAWNDKMAVMGSYGTDKTGNAIFNFFKTKPEESIAYNDNVKALMSKTHDIYTFASFDKLADNMSAKAAAGALNIDPKALKGNYFTGYGDFEKGQIVSKSEFKINKEITKEWGLLFKDNVKTDFSKYMNGQNLGIAMTLALDMKGLKEIINANPQFRMFTKSGEEEFEFSIDDLCKALDGDVVITAMPNMGDNKDEKWSGMMGFKIGDKAFIQKLLSVLVKKEILTKEDENNYRFAGIADDLSKGYVEKSKLTIKNDVFFIGDDKSVTNLTDKGSVNTDVKEVLNKNIFGLFMDFNKLLANSEDMKEPEITDMKLMFNAQTGESVMKVRDQNENSLKSLMRAANKWFLKAEAEKEKLEKEREAEVQ